MAGLRGLRGSSPLTRGKRERRVHGSDQGRLIPAHAGKTTLPTGRASPSWAHPRSRGENIRAALGEFADDGSSPLTRGKRLLVIVGASHFGLIPAHAGKTRGTGHYRPAPAAHPRSRGENLRNGPWSVLRGGSSPLTRGKRVPFGSSEEAFRLIPAHAGKTRQWLIPTQGQEAHPRSRGENPPPVRIGVAAPGSSPLTRGKRTHTYTVHARGRLIPAHAGKTSEAPIERHGRAAHPRSRGENLTEFTHYASVTGSSPLTRGKLTLV